MEWRLDVDQTGAIERVIAEMESADQVHENRRASRLEKAAKVRVDPDMPEEYARILRQAKVAEAEVEVKGWDADHAARLVDMRASGQAALDEAREQLANERYKIHLPTFTPDQWAEAAARKVFVTEDVGDTDVGELPELHRQAAANADQVGTYLIARAGLKRADAVLDNVQGDTMERAAAAQARDALYSAAFGEAWSAWQKDAATLAALDRELARPRGHVERLERGTYMADHLGVALTPEQMVEQGIV